MSEPAYIFQEKIQKIVIAAGHYTYQKMVAEFGAKPVDTQTLPNITTRVLSGIVTSHLIFLIDALEEHEALPCDKDMAAESYAEMILDAVKHALIKYYKAESS